LPPYSPDLSPIEQVFAKLKYLMRNAAEQTKYAARRRVGTLLDQFDPEECANYFVNSGYASALDRPALVWCGRHSLLRASCRSKSACDA
jgi:hypothetical protein